VTVSSENFPTVATAGVVSQFVLTMRDASANAVSCNSSALRVRLAGTGYLDAVVSPDALGACRVLFAVIKVCML
jgi:hypothetical protein